MNGKTLQDIMKDCPCDPAKWCFLKELVKHIGLKDDAAEQIRLIFTLKFLMSTKVGRDVGEEVAWASWVNDGYAARFREVYKDGMNREELEHKIFVEKW
jgi:hypothetical protein